MGKKQNKDQLSQQAGIMALTIEAGTLFIPKNGEHDSQLPGLLAEFEAYCELCNSWGKSKGSLRFILDNNRIGHVETLTKLELTKMLFRRTRRSFRLRHHHLAQLVPSVMAKLRALASRKNREEEPSEHVQHHAHPRAVRLPTIRRQMRKARLARKAKDNSSNNSDTSLSTINHDKLAITDQRTEP